VVAENRRRFPKVFDLPPVSQERRFQASRPHRLSFSEGLKESVYGAPASGLLVSPPDVQKNDDLCGHRIRTRNRVTRTYRERPLVGKVLFISRTEKGFLRVVTRVERFGSCDACFADTGSHEFPYLPSPMQQRSRAGMPGMFGFVGPPRQFPAPKHPGFLEGGPSRNTESLGPNSFPILCGSTLIRLRDELCVCGMHHQFYYIDTAPAAGPMLTKERFRKKTR